MEDYKKRNELYEVLAPIDVSLQQSQAILTALADQFETIEDTIRRRKDDHGLIADITEKRWKTWANLVDLAQSLNASQRRDLEALE